VTTQTKILAIFSVARKYQLVSQIFIKITEHNTKWIKSIAYCLALGKLLWVKYEGLYKNETSDISIPPVIVVNYHKTTCFLHPFDMQNN